MEEGNCVYIIKTSKRLYKIGKTKDLQQRLSVYHTHLPIVFRVVRQYLAKNMNELEEALHIVYQHKRVKGEWFELKEDDLIICDNIARNYALENLQKQKKPYRIEFNDNPQIQVMEANAKYLNDYARVAEDIKMGISTEETVELYHGTINKTIVQTVRRILEYQTPNSEMVSEWIFVVSDLEKGLTTNQIVDKYHGRVSIPVVQTIRRVLKNQLY